MLARRGFLGALAGAALVPLSRTAFASEPRGHVLYVVIDRPVDAEMPAHAPNIDGLARAVRQFDPRIHLTCVTISDLMSMDARALDATYEPLAIVGAGSFTEWYQYGVDAEWKLKLDHWMEIIRQTTIPMLAICGSHQLVAAAFNGFGAVAHMNDRGEPIRISQELAASRPRGMWPNPRVGEEGTYPIVASSEGASDPLVRAMPHLPMASAHHKDMVVETRGFRLLYEGDASRAPATDAPDQTRVRCKVQALRLEDPRRLLYTSQFHPEMCAFDESTCGDQGFGAAWVAHFLELASRWWREPALTTRPSPLAPRRA